MTRSPSSLQGKTTEYAQDKQDNEKQIQSEWSPNHITETSSSKGRSWPFPETFKKTTEAPHQETTAPVHLGRLVRTPTALDQPLAFFPIFFCTAVFNFLSLGFLKEHLF